MNHRDSTHFLRASRTAFQPTVVLLILGSGLCARGKDAGPLKSTISPVETKTTVEAITGTARAKALYLRGVGLEEDSGFPKDENKAAELYRQAAEHHYAPAEYNLALLYEEGRGVPQSLPASVRWYRSAAEQGYAEAQNNLGRLYALGRGLVADAQQAVYWYRKAAEQGNVEGQKNLANSYREGRGVGRDFAKAFELFHSAAIQGYATAQNNLALMYANGTGTERNFGLAYAWLSIAATEMPASQKLLEQVRSKLTSEEIHEAERTRNELETQLVLSRNGSSQNERNDKR